MKYVMSLFLTFSFLFLSMFDLSCIYGYLFPLKYEDEIATVAEIYDMDPVLIASVIKCESGFDCNAVSLKGAEGLMQLLPSTAEYLAKKLKYGEYDLKKPEDNIMLGTYYLSLLTEKFENEALALCAYNAGPGNVQKWLSDEDNLDANGALKVVPFEETRNYLKRCEQARRYYNHKRNYFKVN